MAKHSFQKDTPSKITPLQRHRSMNYAIVSSVFSIIVLCCIGGNVLTLVALKLGAKEMVLGLLGFAIAGNLVFSIFTMRAVEKYGKIKVLVFWKTISIFCVLPFLAIPFLANRWPAAACLALLIIAAFLRSATYSLGETGWFPLLQDIVPRRVTGRFFANLRISWQAASLISLLLLAWFLSTQPDWWKFEVIFIVATIAYAIHILTVLGMTENPGRPAKTIKISVIKRFRDVFAEKKLCMLILYIITFGLAATMAEPFKIKFLKDLGYSYGFILAAMAMTSLGAILSLRYWGKLADRFGNHTVFTTSNIGIAIFTLLWIFVGKNTFSLILTPVLFFFWSVFNSGNGIAQTRSILHTIPADRQNQINIVNIFANLSIGIAPLIAGVFLKATSGLSFQLSTGTINNYHILFILAAVLFIVPHLLRRKLRQENDAGTLDVIAAIVGRD